MQIFAVFCIFAVLAFSNGAVIAPNSDQEVDQPRAGVEAKAAVVPPSEFREAVEVQTKEEIAAAAPTSDKEEGAALGRPRRWLHRRRLGCGHAHHGACSGLGCGHHTVGCAGEGCGSGCVGAGCSTGCGGATPCESNTVVLHQDVPVAHPVPVHVPVVKVVHQNVPVPQPVAVPVVNVVHVPVPVVTEAQRPCCSQPQPCCGQAPLSCSPCSG